MNALIRETVAITGTFCDSKRITFCILFLLAVLGGGVTANSEGYYRFANRFEGWVDGPFPGPSGLPERIQGIHEAPVYHADGVTRLAGSEFLAQLYFMEAYHWTSLGTSPTNVWLALGTPAPFGTGANAGFVELDEQARVVGTGPLKGQKPRVQLRVWEASKGRTYEQALAAQGWVGASDLLAVAPGTREAPAVLERLRPIQLRPGPMRTFALDVERIVVAVQEELRIQLLREFYEPDTTIQWFRNGEPLPGSDSQVFYREHFAAADEGHYFARITVSGQVFETQRCIVERRRDGILDFEVQPPQPTLGQPFRMEALLRGRGSAIVRWTHRGVDGPRVISEVIRALSDEPLRVELSVALAQLGFYDLEVLGAELRHTRSLVKIEGGVRVLQGTFTQGGSLSVEPYSSFGYMPGTVVTLRVMMPAGYVLDHWTGDLSGSENPKVVVLDRDLKVGAVLRNEAVGSRPRAITQLNVEPRSVRLGQPFRVTATVQGGRGPIEVLWIHHRPYGGSILQRERKERTEEAVLVEFESQAAQIGLYQLQVRWVDGASTEKEIAVVRGDVTLTWEATYPSYIEITPDSSFGHPRGASVRLRVVYPPEFEFVRWIGDLADRGSENPTVAVLDRSKHAVFDFRLIWPVIRLGQIRCLVVNEFGRGVGPSIVGQLVGGPSPDAMVPLGMPSPISSGSYSDSQLGQHGFLAIPGVASGNQAFIQLRVWELAKGFSWDAAKSNGGRYGQTLIRELQTVDDIRRLSDLPALVSFPKIVLNSAPVFGPMSDLIEVGLGSNALLQANLNGSAPIVFEWWKDGVRLPGPHSEVLKIIGAKESDAGTYVLRASNEFGTRESPPIRVRLIPAPVIQDIRIRPNPRSREPLRIEVDAISESELHSTWKINEYSVLSGPGVPTLDLSEAPAGTYTLIIENSVGGKIETNLLSLAPRFRLTWGVEGRGQVVADPPSDGFYPAGTQVTLDATPGTQHEFVGWFGDVSGIQPRLVVVVDRDKSVRAVFSGSGGSVYAANRISGVDGIDAPVFHVDGVTRLEGSTFRVQLFAGPLPTSLTPVGDPMVFLTGVGAGYFAGSIQRLPSVSPGAAGWVQVRAWDASAGATYDEAVRSLGLCGASAMVRVTTGGLGTPPSLPARLEGLTSFRLEVPSVPAVIALNGPSRVAEGDPLQWEATLAGTVPVTVQWFKNGDPIPGATDPVFTIPAAGLDDAGGYSIRLENPLGTVMSGVHEVAVVEPRAIRVRAEADRIRVGETTTLIAEASGRPGFVVAWFTGSKGDISNPVGLPGLVLPTSALEESTSFWARVTDVRGVTDSDAVRVEVVRHPQTLTIEAPDSVVFSETPIPIVAMSDRGLPVALQVIEGPASFTAGVLTADGAGTIRIRASQEGNERFQPAEIEKAIIVEKALAGVVLSRLEAIAEGSPVSAVAVTDPPGLPVLMRYDGRPEPPVEAGSYAVSVEVDHPNYHGSASGILTLTPPVFLLEGRVFGDLNGNGLEDGGESGLSNVVVRLNGEGIQREATTSEQGAFQWESLKQGSFWAEVVTPSGFQGTTPALRTVVGQTGQRIMLQFGFQEVATVGGTVFVDTDGDGLRGAQEAGLAGVTVRLRGVSLDRSAITDRDGWFGFFGLVPGNYEVEEDDLAGYVSTTANQRSVTVARGGAAAVVFGDLPVQSISGAVFLDTNGNGIRDAGEEGAPGIEVTLHLAPGTPESAPPLHQQVTDRHGAFRFESVPVGNYVVRHALPEDYTGLVSSGPALASPRSHGNGGTGTGLDVSRAVRLDDGAAAAVRFAILQRGRVSGVVFEDLDGDRNQTPLERGLEGVRIDAHDASTGESVAAVVTGPDGRYSMALASGRSLRLSQTALAGYLAAPSILVSAGASQAAVVNFPNRTLGTVSGRVFHDENGDGDFSRGESGMGGIRVGFVSEGLKEREVWTSGDGSFAFAGVPSGRVTLSVVASDGYEFSTPSQLSFEGTPSQAVGVQFGQRRVEEPKPAGPYELWVKARRFPPGTEVPRADPDGDGVSNLWEFMGGTDPLAENATFGPLGIVVMAGVNRLAGMEWNRSHAARDLELILERSFDLKVWERVASDWSVVGTADTFERVRWLDPEPIATQTPRFLRLRVTVP